MSDQVTPERSVASVVESTTHPSTWQMALLILGAVLACWTAVYWQTLQSLTEIWNRSDTFAHGWVVLPIVLYMLWTRRKTIRLTATPRSEPRAIFLLLPLTLAWWIAEAVHIQVLAQLSIVLMLPVLVLIVLGWSVMRAMAYPLAYLLFAVPMGEIFIPHLQDITAFLTVTALQWTGIPVFWEGRFFSIPGANFEVAKECSGIRYIFASLCLGSLYAYLAYRSYWRRAGFILLSLIIPLVANGLRAYGIVMTAYLSDMKLAVGVDHIIYGWVFFGLIMFILFWFGSLWREPQADSPVAAVDAHDTPLPPRTTLLTAMATIVVLGIAPLNSSARFAETDANPPFPFNPASIKGWQQSDRPSQAWSPVFHGAGHLLQESYRHGDKTVDLAIAYYARETQGAELVNANNHLYDKDAWSRTSDAAKIISLKDGTERTVHELLLRSSSGYLAVWYWYDVAGLITADPITAKLAGAWAKLRRSDSASAWLAVAIPYEGGDSEQYQQILIDFLQANAEVLDAVVQPPSMTGRDPSNQR